MKLISTIAAVLVSAAAIADDCHLPQLAPERSLPALFAICEKLGIPKVDCSNGFTVNGLNQTDPALWYRSFSATPDNVPPADCYKAVAVKRYQMYDDPDKSGRLTVGAWGTEYACLTPPEDDQVTADELDAIQKWAQRSNSIVKKTLRDHETALQVKRLAAQLARQP